VAVVHGILTELVDALEAHRAFVHAFEADGRTGRAFERLRPGTEAHLDEASLAVGTRARSGLESGHSVFLGLDGATGTRRAILLPLRESHRTTGVLGIEADRDDRLLRRELPWLRAIAAALGSCLGRQLHEQRQAQRHFELRTIDQLHALLERSGSIDQLLTGANELVLDVFGCERAAVVQASADAATQPWVRASVARPNHSPLPTTALDVPPPRKTELQGILQTPGVRTFDAASGRTPLFDGDGTARSEACVSFRPSQHTTFVLLLQQNSFERIWTVDEKWLLSETGRRLSEAAASLMSVQLLARSEDRYRQILAASPDLILVFTPAGILEEVFSSGPEQLGVRVEDAVGRHLHELLPRNTAEHLWSAMQRALGGTAPERVEYTLPIGGRDRWFSAQARGFGPPERRRILWMARDVTERTDLQARLLQAQKLESVGLLAGGVAHDFNNLLTAILGYVDLVRSELPDDHPLQTDLAHVADAGERGTRLAKQLLLFARRDTMVPVPVRIDELIEGMASMLRRVVGDDVEFRTETAAAGDIVSIDPGQLEQVLMNLVVNARDAMPNGGVLRIRTGRAQVREDTTELEPGPYTTLEVEDTGVGMDAETVQHIFDPFFTTKELGRGTGLGLATCYGIVRQHGGRIDVQSRPNVGTRFRILLPRNDGTDTPPAPERGPDDPVGDETILLVEDEPIVRRLTERGLVAFGYRVLTAASGEEAIQHSVRHEGPIHLLITDMMMPGMRGTQLSGLLLESRPGMRVLYISGYSDELPSVARAGTHRFVQKPFTPRELARRAREVLDS
jgi:PAS domain S-box-containing protein